jgi:DNA-binding NarL/FixJ family response regulator
VLLVEDHTVVRKGLRRILETQPQIEVVAEAADGREALRLAENCQPDVAVVDITLPLLNGIELTRQLRRVLPRTRVLILSMHSDPAYVRRALEAGARGYLVKDADDLDLTKAVLALNGGGSYFSPSISHLVLKGFLRGKEEFSVEDELGRLSSREREVLQLVAEGKSSKEIAQVLNLSVSTVETHRKHIMEKLGLHSTAAIVRFAVRKGLVD